MSSLFHDGHCSCKECTSKGTSKCKGCVCEVLHQLAHRRIGDICQAGRAQRVLITNKGTQQPLFLDGSTQPTEFTVADFDPETCCAILTYEVPAVGEPNNRETRTYIADCRSIAGVVCVSS